MGVLRHFSAATSTILFSILAVGVSAQSRLSLEEAEGFEKEGKYIVDVLQNYHYGRSTFSEFSNREIIEKYLDALDPLSRVLPSADVEFVQHRFERTLKSVYLLRGDYSPAFEIMDRFLQRAEERVKWIDALLAKEGTLKSEHRPPSTKDNVPLESTVLDGWWTDHVLDELLTARLDGRDEAEAKRKVSLDYHRWLEGLRKTRPLETREKFVDAMVRSFDPHSGYFSANSANDFSTMMAGELCAAGVLVRRKDGRCYIEHVFEGSAAGDQPELKIGDELLTLDEAGKAPMDASLAFIRDVESRLEGPAGSAVTLKVKSPRSKEPREVTLVRKSFVLPRAKASAGVIIKEDGTSTGTGYLTWPDFYHSEDANRPSSASKDVIDLLDQLKKEGVHSLIIDLRNNPGGSLGEALSLLGLFLGDKEGATTGGSDGKTTTLVCTEAERFSGPVVVLTNSKSASASELFSGAMKYHRRGVVLGAASTFGKGSVQNYLDLGKFQGSKKDPSVPWGTLRVTFQVFCNPDGASIQRRGIPSDIVVPQNEESEQTFEREMPGALPEKNLTVSVAAPTDRWLSTAQLSALVATSQKRVAESARWQECEQLLALRGGLTPAHRETLDLDKELSRRRLLLSQISTLESQRLERAKSTGLRFHPLFLPAVANHQSALETFLRATYKERLQSGVIHHGAFYFINDQGELHHLSPFDIEWNPVLAQIPRYTLKLRESTGTSIEEAMVEKTLLRFASGEKNDFEKLSDFLKRFGETAGITAEIADKAVKELLRTIAKDQMLAARDQPLQSPTLQEALDLLAEMPVPLSSAPSK